MLGYTATLARDLEAFSAHGKRATITRDDTLLCVRRNPRLAEALRRYHDAHPVKSKGRRPGAGGKAGEAGEGGEECDAEYAAGDVGVGGRAGEEVGPGMADSEAGVDGEESDDGDGHAADAGNSDDDFDGL